MKRLACGLVGLLALGSSIAGCGGEDEITPPPAAPTGTVAPTAAPKAPAPIPEPQVDGRLPRTVTPLRYALDLDVDPSKETFRGRVRVEVTVGTESPYVVLHGRDLTLGTVVATSDSARGQIKHEGRLAIARPSSRDAAAKDELVLAFEPPLAIGAATLTLEYEAPFGRSLSGLYRAKDQGRDYAFTQFEPTDARRAFPCFDEPAFKTPFELRVHVPRGMTAVANAPELGRADDALGTRFTFAPTPPMPSYLVALAVGELEVVEGRRSPFPIRVVTTKGRSEHAKAALAPAAEIVDALARMVGAAYPYAKLDLVSVPDFGAGAMENPGLITFREELLLADPQRPSPAQTRAREHVLAHELAHQWFGDLVTMEWWDDLWLNEAFATWGADRVLEDLRPTYRTALGAAKSGLGVMDFDALPSSKPVHRPIANGTESMEAFDGITYQKGAAVIRMLERAATPRAFREGIARYLSTHAFKTAKTEDLVRAISEAAGRDLAPMARSFLEQSGVPAVSVERDCSDPKHATVVLSQYPWHPMGAPPPARPLKQWQIPLCLREPDHDVACTTLSEPRVVLPLTADCSPKAWLYPNADESSYVRFSFAKGEVERLTRALPKLEPRERAGLVAHAWASVRAGELAPDAFLPLVRAYDAETEREIVESQIAAIWGLGALVVNGDDARPRLRELVRERLGPRKRALGWGPADLVLAPKKKPGPDDDEARLLRRSVLFTLGELGEDEDTLREAGLLADAWLADPKRIDPETGALALELGSRRAGVARFDALVRAATTLTEPHDRIAALRALGAFDDPNLVSRALDFAVDPQVTLKDSRYVLEGALRHRSSIAVVLSWIEANWERAVRRYEGPAARRLIDVVSVLCDRRSIDDARAFYKAHPVEAGAHRLEHALQEASRCAELAETLGPAIAKALPAASPVTTVGSKRGPTPK